MRVKILRKLLILLIMVAPVFTITDCRKQEKCGCNGDSLFTLDREQAKVYFNETGTNISFTRVNGSPYDTYYFCNPGEMFPKLKDAKSGDILLLSGSAFWECNYLYQSSNYSYYTQMRVYQVQVTDVVSDLYGKGDTQTAE